MRDHNVEDYADLRDMDTTDVAVLDDADRDCLEDLGYYLVSVGSWRRFAIWLLHKHFDPSPREVFVEAVRSAPRGTYTAPAQRRPGLHATSVRFDTDARGGVGVVGTEFAGPDGFGSASPLHPGDESVLAGLAERLRAHGKAKRFGVRLIRNPLGLSEAEVLVESCDIVGRALHCRVVERDDVSAADSVETTWRWKPSPETERPNVTMWCQMMCGCDGQGNHYIEGHITTPDLRVGDR
jgi:hypothetical protein